MLNIKIALKGSQITKKGGWNNDYFRNVDDLVKKIRGGGYAWDYRRFGSDFTISSYCNPDINPVLADGDNGKVVVAWNLNKVRAKINKFKKPVKWTKKRLKANGFPTDIDRYDYFDLVHPTHWTATVYRIPVAVLTMLKLRVVQTKHTFKLVPA